MDDTRKILPDDKAFEDDIVSELEKRHVGERDMLFALSGKYNNLKEIFFTEITEIKQNLKEQGNEKKLVIDDLDRRTRELEKKTNDFQYKFDEGERMAPDFIKRLEALEHLRDTSNYPEVATNEKADHKWIEAYRTTWKAYLALAVITGGVIGFILANVLNVKKLFGL